MYEVINAERKGNREEIIVRDSVSGKKLRFAIPVNLYSEKFLIEKIKRSEKTGITGIGKNEDSLAEKLIGKRFNKSTGVFE